MKKKNGFTLIELLAVIAILALLAILTVPKVIDVYNTAKKNVFVTSAKKIYDTAAAEYLQSAISNNGEPATEECLYCKSQTDTNNTINISGEDDIYYYVVLNNKGEVEKIIV